MRPNRTSWLTVDQKGPTKPYQRPWKNSGPTLHPWWECIRPVVIAGLWLFGWTAVAMLTSCVQTTVTRTVPGGVETTKSYGLTDRAFGAIDTSARYYFGVPQERGSK